MRPARIVHARTIIPSRRRDTIISQLHERGVCQLAKNDIVEFTSPYSFEKAEQVENLHLRFHNVNDILHQYKAPEQTTSVLKDFFLGKKTKKLHSDKHHLYDVLKMTEDHLDKIEEQVIHAQEQIVSAQEAIRQNSMRIRTIKLLPDMQTNYLVSSENIGILAGIVTRTSMEQIKEEINAPMMVDEVDKLRLFIIVMLEPAQKESIERVMHRIGFQSIEIPDDERRPQQIIESIKKENQVHETAIAKAKKNLHTIAKQHKNELDILSEEIGLAKEKHDAKKLFKASDALSVFDAWIPEKMLPHFENVLKEYAGSYHVEIQEKEDAPTHLENHKYAAPFENILRMYSLPRYGDFDPTWIIAIFFTIFFGFMLDDFFYGLIMTIAGIVVMKGAGRHNASSRDMGFLITALGVSTMFWGVIFGAYFGNIFQELGIPLPIVLDAMKQVIPTMALALTLGALHMSIGLIIGFIENLRKGKKIEAFSQQGVWLVFMLALISYITAGVGLIPVFVGTILLIIAILMQIVFTFKKSGGISAALSVFDFTGFLGDLFSYARLMALGIGTSGISLAINMMAILAATMIPYVGIVLAIFIFIVGHIFNMVMNGLGAFIHAVRLHFLELFTKFYEGGGEEYKPFKADRKKTFVKLE
ncbi:V-type ATP synthase subunit I [Candidatus Woesearchaeota archaeon]|nr:V-type ATP synthase subunit I [Candidatus Woesearchaeota archaeon]